MMASVRIPRSVATLLAVLVLAVAASPAGWAQGSVKWSAVNKTVKAKPGDVVELKVKAVIPPGWHLYTPNPMNNSTGPLSAEITVGGSDVVSQSGSISSSPRGKKKFDENFEGDVEYWTGTVTITVPVKIAASAADGKQQVAVSAYHQICDIKTGICNLPKDDKIDFTIEVSSSTDEASATEPTTDPRELAKRRQDSINAYRDSVADAKQAYSDSVRLADSLAALEDEDGSDTNSTADNMPGDGNDEDTASAVATIDEDEIATAQKRGLGAFLWLAASAGALALLTPCVFPMIPITVSFFTKRAENSRGRALRDASFYSLGIIVTFSLLGLILALLLGATGINDMATNPIMNLAIAAIFVIFALSLFGMYEIQLPPSMLNKLNMKAQGNGIGSVMLMGLVFSLTSFTCTVPFIGGLMATASTGEWTWPLMGAAMFAAVFSIPFFVLALFPALLKKLPKSGGWLNSVKVVMGFLEIAFAIKFLSNADLVWGWGVLTRELFLAIWIAITVLVSIYLLGKFHLPHDSPIDRIGPVRMLFSTAFLAIGFWLLTGLFGRNLGEVDAFLPPDVYPGDEASSAQIGIGPPGATPAAGGAVSEENWIQDDYPRALEIARETGKPIFIDFTGYTCTNCRWMEKNMFPKQEVAELMDKYVLVKLYTDRRDSINKAQQKMLVEDYKTSALPYYVVLTPDETVLGKTAFTRDVDEFADFLRKGLNVAARAEGEGRRAEG